MGSFSDNLHLDIACHCKVLTRQLSLQSQKPKVVSLVIFRQFRGSLETYSIDLSKRALDHVYVAFSYVRMDRLDDIHGGNIHRCQVSRLQQLANDALPDTQAPVPFWIDFLCFNMEASPRFRELQKIQQAFNSATKVVVLDKSCVQTLSEDSLKDLLCVQNSRWAQRLWTIQEGAVAQDLLYCFSNRFVSSSELLQAFDGQLSEQLTLSRNATLSRSTFSEDTEKGPRLLMASMMLSDDLKEAEAGNILAPSDAKALGHRQVFDRERLRKILRLALLATPQMRYLRTRTDLKNLRNVREELLHTYTDEKYEIGESSIDRTRHRLERMMLIDVD